jgi:hypothetical protein
MAASVRSARHSARGTYRIMYNEVSVHKFACSRASICMFMEVHLHLSMLNIKVRFLFLLLGMKANVRRRERLSAPLNDRCDYLLSASLFQTTTLQFYKEPTLVEVVILKLAISQPKQPISCSAPLPSLEITHHTTKTYTQLHTRLFHSLKTTIAV